MKSVAKVIGLVLAYLVLFVLGTSLFAPEAPHDSTAGNGTLLVVLVIAMVDTALLGTWIARARHRGIRLWAEAAIVFYGVKSFSSALEVWWFVDKAWIPDDMLPQLLTMMLPLSLGWTALAVRALAPSGPTEAAPPLRRSPADLGARVFLAGALLYPVLFFLFGYYVAWQHEAVRSYYGGPAVALPPIQHFAALFAGDPWVIPFEMLRGLLWVALGWPMLRGTRGPWWLGGLLFALTMALVQNDVHLLPNPLMPDLVRQWHFIETSSSNFLFALGTAALLAPRGAWRTEASRRPVGA